jgi:3-oxoacyl-[acyl-carrier protein] reductase
MEQFLHRGNPSHWKDSKMVKLAKKVAIVTGASKGIGAAIARGLAGAGAHVIVNYASSRDGADAVVKAITAAGGKAVAVHGDVAKPEDVKGLVDAAINEFGRLDILVNNSGVWDIVPIERVTEEQFRRSFDVNVLGPLMTIREALKHIGEGGSIINISSNATTLHPPGSSIYTATKSALEGITGVLANELGPPQDPCERNLAWNGRYRGESVQRLYRFRYRAFRCFPNASRSHRPTGGRG